MIVKTKGENKMKNIIEIRDWLLENAVNKSGDLMLDKLDFSEFDGDIHIGYMRVKGNLHQHGHAIEGNLDQSFHEVQGSLFQNGHKVQDNLYQSNSTAQGSLLNEDNRYGGKLYENESKKLLTKVTVEELAKMGYELTRDDGDDC